jgi:hypothetical protein
MKGRVQLPERDADKRELLCTMLALPKKARGRLSVEELESICIKRGYLKIVKREMDECNHNFRGGDRCPFCGFDRRGGNRQ